ncbi:MAG: hypothetical protein JJT76_12060 [Clostridiaceae bacterium]|nr:hypothetical protein [Clostridiaceae bacterium]
MKKRRPRGMETMPLAIKFDYLKVLFSMANVDGDINQLEMMELYRLMGKLKCTSKERIALLKSTGENNDIKNTLDNLLSHDLEQQEKNIVRFSLIKDLLIVMGADYDETLEEVVLFNTIKEELYITDEQLHLTRSEYEEDKQYFKKNIEIYDIKGKAKKTAYQVAGISIPLAFMYANNYFNNPKKRCARKHLTVSSLGKHVLLGVVSLKSIEWLLQKEDRKKSNLDKKLFLECNKIHETAKLYVTRDIIHIQKILSSNQDQFLLQQIKLLKKTVGTLEKTEPKIV